MRIYKSERLKSIKSSSYNAPRVAVWWYLPTGVIVGDSEGYGGGSDNDKLDADILTDFAGNIQLNVDHVDLWGFVRNKPTVRSFKDYEYEELPRGRVVFNSRTRKWIVIGESNTVKDPRFQSTIKREYDLPPNTLFEVDDHYSLDTETLDFSLEDRDAAADLTSRFMGGG